MLKGKSADIVIATGGATLGSPVDFVSGYLKQVFSFIGIDQIEVFGADGMNVDAEASRAEAQAIIDRACPATTSLEVA